jgi:hypothetical protein
MLIVIYKPLYAECHYAECRYAECRYAECRYAECRYAECRYAECRSAVNMTQGSDINVCKTNTLAYRVRKSFIRFVFHHSCLK